MSGDGLFAKRQIDKGEIICMYTGDLQEVDNNNDSLYIVKVRCKVAKGDVRDMYLDAKNVDNTAGRYANDARHTQYENNAVYDSVLRFHKLIKKHYVRIVSTCCIPKDSEILVDYGECYWNDDT